MAINIYLSGATVFIDDSINNENIELNTFYYQVNEATNTVAIQDKAAGISRTYSTTLIADADGVTIGTSTEVRVYLSAFQNVVSSGASVASGEGTENEVLTSTDRNTQLLENLLEAQNLTNRILRKIYNPK